MYKVTKTVVIYGDSQKHEITMSKLIPENQFNSYEEIGKDLLQEIYKNEIVPYITKYAFMENAYTIIHKETQVKQI